MNRRGFIKRLLAGAACATVAGKFVSEENPSVSEGATCGENLQSIAIGSGPGIGDYNSMSPMHIHFKKQLEQHKAYYRHRQEEIMKYING